jgi:hypothetical protein
MMEAANTSEMLVNFYQTTRRYNPEDSHLHTIATWRPSTETALLLLTFFLFCSMLHLWNIRSIKKAAVRKYSFFDMSMVYLGRSPSEATRLRFDQEKSRLH